ncbi:MAG: hypothetical protein AABZ47_02900 [Planctomycetota bacterium]
MNPNYPPWIRRVLLGLLPLYAGILIYPAHEEGQISFLILPLVIFGGFVLLFFPIMWVFRQTMRLETEEGQLSEPVELIRNAFLQASCCVAAWAWMFAIPSIAKQVGLITPMRGVCAVFVNWGWVHTAVAVSAVMLLTIIEAIRNWKRVQARAKATPQAEDTVLVGG